MMDFLKIVTAFFVALVILAGVVFLWLRFKLKRWVANITDQLTHGLGVSGPAAAFLIPLRIRLEQTSDPDWVDHEFLEEATGDLTHLGFEVIGDYDIEPAGVSARGLVHGGESMYAVIYQHPLMAQGTWIDLFTHYADGSSVTFSTSPHATLLDSPPGNSRQTFEDASAEELFERMQQALPDGVRKEVTAARFVDEFERYYADEMDWRIERGGPSPEEIERAAEQAGTQVDDSMAQQIRQLWQAHVAQHHDTRLREHFLEHSGLSAAEYQRVRDRLVFVHDGMTPEMVFESIEEFVPYPTDDLDDAPTAPTAPTAPADSNAEDQYEALLERINALAETRPPREAFAALKAILPPEAQFEHLQTLDDPVPADVYVGPQEA